MHLTLFFSETGIEAMPQACYSFPLKLWLWIYLCVLPTVFRCGYVFLTLCFGCTKQPRVHFLISGVMNVHGYFCCEKHQIFFISQMPLESSKNSFGYVPQEDVHKDIVMLSCSVAGGLWGQKTLNSAI